MKTKISKFFDGYSADFNAIYQSGRNPLQRLLDKWFRKSMWMRYNKTLEACRSINGKTVLDIGCGGGLYCFALAKMGAEEILGIDFAPQMIAIAKHQSSLENLDKICTFIVKDFFDLEAGRIFDYIIVMGVMDYIDNPEAFVMKVAQHTRYKAVFSFPKAGGFLAWQRKLRYRFKCPLYLYTEEQITGIFKNLHNWHLTVELIERDYFVTIEKGKDETI